MTKVERNTAIKTLIAKRTARSSSQTKTIALAKARLKKSGVYTPNGILKKKYK